MFYISRLRRPQTSEIDVVPPPFPYPVATAGQFAQRPKANPLTAAGRAGCSPATPTPPKMAPRGRKMRCSRKGLETGRSTAETVFEKLIFIDLAQALGIGRLLII